MGAVSLTTLIARARERADMPVAGFVPDSATGIYAWANEGAQALHEKLVHACGAEYSEATSALTIDGVNTDFALPADFFKLYGVDFVDGSITRTLLPYNRAERNALSNLNASWIQPSRYMLAGAYIRFLPKPTATTGTLYYAPVLQVTAGTTTLPYTARGGVAFTVGEIVTEASSGVTGTVLTDTYAGAGAGTLVLQLASGTFLGARALAGTTSGAAATGGSPTVATSTTNVLGAGADTVDFPNGWEKYIVAYMARQMLVKEESDPRAVEADLARWDRDIEEMKQERDAAFPQSAVDMDNIDPGGFW